MYLVLFKKSEHPKIDLYYCCVEILETMNVDKNSYFIKYGLQNGEEHAQISHYAEVWEDGFTVEDYNISSNSISFEDASWHGFSTHINNSWKLILARNFNRWSDEINISKRNLIDMGRNAGTEILKELKVGDCVFITIPPYDSDDEFEKSEYCFLEVVSVDNDFVCSKQMYISTYFFNYSCDKVMREDDDWIKYALENNNVIRIDKSMFYRAVEDFLQLTTKLISEIKKNT